MWHVCFLLMQYIEIPVPRSRLDAAHENALTHIRRKQAKEVAHNLKQQHGVSNIVLHNRESGILLLCNERIPSKRMKFAIKLVSKDEKLPRVPVEMSVILADNQ